MITKLLVIPDKCNITFSTFLMSFNFSQLARGLAVPEDANKHESEGSNHRTNQTNIDENSQLRGIAQLLAVTQQRNVNFMQGLVNLGYISSVLDVSQ